jgi:hypothetical protein
MRATPRRHRRRSRRAPLCRWRPPQPMRAWLTGLIMVEQLPRAPVVPQTSEGHGRPDGRMGVLPAVFAHAGDVALDVAGFSADWSKGGSRSWIRPASRRTRRVSSASMAYVRALMISPAPESTDQLWAMESIWHSGCSTTPAACRRRSRRGGTSRRPSHAARYCGAVGPPPLAALDEWQIAAQAGHLGEAHEHLVEEESEPDAFAFALAHQVHAVVPVAGAHERQAVLAEPQAVQDGAHAVFVKARRLVGRPGRS